MARRAPGTEGVGRQGRCFRRVGKRPASVLLAEGQIIDLLPPPDGVAEAGVLAVTVNYPGLGRDVAVGVQVLVDSGLIRLEVVNTSPQRVRCRVIVAAKLGNRRHINLPGVKVRLPALTAKDRGDIAVGVEEGWIFLRCRLCGRRTTWIFCGGCCRS